MGNPALTAFLVAHRAFTAHFSGRWADAEKDGYPFGIALNTRVLGQIAAAAGDTAEARRRVAPALERFIALGARPETARCHALLANLAETEAERTGHRRRAEALFRKMGMAWDLERLRAGAISFSRAE